MDLSPLESILAIAGSVGTAMAILWRAAVRPFYKRVRAHMVMLECIPQLIQDVGKISEQLHTNGGTSLRDSIDRIEMRQLITSQVIGTYMVSQSVAFFHANKNGSIVEASRSLCKLLERTETELLGTSWLAWIQYEQREEVNEEFMDAITNGREFEKSFEVFNDKTVMVNVNMRAYPLMDTKRQLIGYFGTFSRV